MDCFLEFISPVAAQRLIARRTGSGRRCILGGRHVTMEVVGMEVLMKWLFPKAKGIEWLRGGSVRALNRDNQDTKIEIVSREELVMILSHARTPHRVSVVACTTLQIPPHTAQEICYMVLHTNSHAP